MVATPGRNPNIHCNIPPVPPRRIHGCQKTWRKIVVSSYFKFDGHTTEFRTAVQPHRGRKSGVSSSFLPEEMNRHGQKSGVSSSFLPEKSGKSGGKSGVSSSFLPEEMNRHGITRKGKSGVSSSFLPEEMNRHGITRKDELTPDYPRLTGKGRT
jgi:hypothetical protein